MSCEHVVSSEALRQFVVDVFRGCGLANKPSRDAADVLMWASLRGVDTHGVRNLKAYYVDNIQNGKINATADWQIEQETPSTARVDGDAGLGLAIACDAMRLAIAKAERSEIGIVHVHNSNHLGAAGYFAHLAVERGFLGACLSGHFFGSGHDIGVAPINSKQPMFSTNPISFAVPCGRHPPFVLDMSTSVVTVNRVERRGQLGQRIPHGWARDSAGNPTTDPAAARLLAPLGGTPEMGGHKGVGLAMLVSILTGVLSGAWTKAHKEDLDARPRFTQSTPAHCFAALRVDSYRSPESFRQAMDAMFDAIQAAPRDHTNEPIFYPGDREYRTAQQRSRDGVPITNTERRDFRDLAEKFNVAMPR